MAVARAKPLAPRRGIEALRYEMAARALVRALENYLSEVATCAPHDPDGLIDQYESPLGRRAHLEAVRAGRIPGFKRGKKVFARRVDVLAYIEEGAIRRPGAGEQGETERSLGPAQVAAQALDELDLE